MNKTNLEVSTKVNATDKEATVTKLTLDWEGMSPEDIRALAQQAFVVKWQAAQRRAGVIPSEAEVKVVEHKVGVRAPKAPVNLLDLVAKMSPEDKAALLAKLAG